jgi:hypothetical protein
MISGHEAETADPKPKSHKRSKRKDEGKKKKKKNKKKKKCKHRRDEEPDEKRARSDDAPGTSAPAAVAPEIAVERIADERGMPSDRFSGHKTMLPTAIADRAWRPYGPCRDLTCIAASIGRLADVMADEGAGMGAAERVDIVAKLRTIEAASRRTADSIHAQFVDGIASSLVRQNNPEILGDGPLIPQQRSLAHQSVHRQQHRSPSAPDRKQQRKGAARPDAGVEISSLSQI